MHISLVEFCEVVSLLQRSNAEKALAVLWYRDRQQPEVAMTSGQLTKVLVDHHAGTPNATQLAVAIRKTKLANESKAGFSLKPGSRKIIHDWLPAGIDGMQPTMDHSTGYLADAVWIGTRGYIESVCKQLNGCFRAAYYDAASVMLRRLMETLIIEAYEKIKGDSVHSANPGAAFEPICSAGRLPAFAAVPSCGDKCLSLWSRQTRLSKRK